MTRAVLFMAINWDPDDTGIGAELPGPDAVRLDFNVTDPDKPVTIVITPGGMNIYTQDQPVRTLTEMPTASVADGPVLPGDEQPR